MGLRAANMAIALVESQLQAAVGHRRLLPSFCSIGALSTCARQRDNIGWRQSCASKHPSRRHRRLQELPIVLRLCLAYPPQLRGVHSTHAAATAVEGIMAPEGPAAVKKIHWQKIKNIRDLSSVPGSNIKPGRVFRTGFPSEASEADMKHFRKQVAIKTMIDLRSSKEISMDKAINADVYQGFEDVVVAPGVGDNTDDKAEGKRRYFISLLDERLYQKGVFKRLSGRDKARVLMYFGAMPISNAAYEKAKQIFLKKINEGGLVLLNELLLEMSGKGIRRSLQLLATKERHPVALYCTAGKDRTGLVMTLALAALGVPDKAILDDYILSATAYEELDDRSAMVGALEQHDLDPEKFLLAPRYVMEDTLASIRQRYGSVEGYLDSIGFDSHWRQQLKEALTGR